MNFHASPEDIGGHGRGVSDIGQQLNEGTRKGRSVRITAPGLSTGPAFDAFRDAWLGQGEQISLSLDETGTSTTRAGVDHRENDDAIQRGYDAIRPPK